MASIPEGFELVEQTPIPAGFELAPQQVGAEDVSNRLIDSNGIDNGGSGIDQGLISDIEAGFQKIPGAPQLSEFSAAANRSIFDVIDFLGPDTVNSILSLSGSERRVPTLRESLGSEGGFVEPGLQRDILQAAGETVPAALGLGTAIRGAAARLAPATGGESVGAGVLREAGKSTVAQDVGLGAVSAAGTELGEVAAGEEGALAGAILAPLAVAIPLTAAKSVATNLLKKSTPSVDKLKETARGIYQSLDDSGVTIPKESFAGLVDDVSRTLAKEGIDPDLTPKATALLKRLNSEKGIDKTLTEIDTLRKVARNAADSTEPSERRLGNITINKIDDFLDGVGDEIIKGVKLPSSGSVVSTRATSIGEQLSFNSTNAKLTGILGDDSFQVGTVAIRDAAKRGQGEGVGIYSDAINEARSRGVKNFLSDNTVEPDAVRVWDSLKRRGLPVKRDPAARFVDDKKGGFWTVDGDGPVFSLDLSKSKTAQGESSEVGQSFKAARDLWQRAKKTEILDQAVSDAELQASGFENGLRTQFRALAKKINSGKLKGFSAEEVQAIRKVADGTRAGNVARFLGKFGILDGVTSRSLTTLGGVGLAGAAGGTGAAAAVPLIGQISGALSKRMTLDNAKMAKSIIQAGKNGGKIASIYVRNTPKGERSPAELAELFLKNQVPIEAINPKTATPLISSAAIIASIAKQNDKKQDQQ